MSRGAAALRALESTVTMGGYGPGPLRNTPGSQPEGCPGRKGTTVGREGYHGVLPHPWGGLVVNRGQFRPLSESLFDLYLVTERTCTGADGMCGMLVKSPVWE